MPYAKVYPEMQQNEFFMIPGVPVWKQHELARDPSFRDLHEQILDSQNRGSLRTSGSGKWSSQKGYDLTIKQEAAILKNNTRAAKKQQERIIEKVQKQPIFAEHHTYCCTLM